MIPGVQTPGFLFSVLVDVSSFTCRLVDLLTGCEPLLFAAVIGEFATTGLFTLGPSVSFSFAMSPLISLPQSTPQSKQDVEDSEGCTLRDPLPPSFVDIQIL